MSTLTMESYMDTSHVHGMQNDDLLKSKSNWKDKIINTSLKSDCRLVDRSIIHRSTNINSTMTRSSRSKYKGKRGS